MRSKIRSEIREKMQINAKMFENLPNCLIFVSSETCCNTFCTTHFEKGTITTKKKILPIGFDLQFSTYKLQLKKVKKILKIVFDEIRTWNSWLQILNTEASNLSKVNFSMSEKTRIFLTVHYAKLELHSQFMPFSKVCPL